MFGSTSPQFVLNLTDQNHVFLIYVFRFCWLHNPPLFCTTTNVHVYSCIWYLYIYIDIHTHIHDTIICKFRYYIYMYTYIYIYAFINAYMWTCMACVQKDEYSSKLDASVSAHPRASCVISQLLVDMPTASSAETCAVHRSTGPHGRCNSSECWTRIPSWLRFVHRAGPCFRGSLGPRQL